MLQAASLKPSALAGSLGMLSGSQTLPDSSTLKLTVTAPGAVVGCPVQYESLLDFSQRAVVTDASGKAVLGSTTLSLVSGCYSQSRPSCSAEGSDVASAQYHLSHVCLMTDRSRFHHPSQSAWRC
jgi:hypothetical protein